jgi:hypothetical protein
MFRNYFSLLFFVGLPVAAVFSQNESESPYQLEWSKEATILTGGLGTSIAGYFLQEQAKPRTTQELSGLRAARLLALDENATDNFSLKADKHSDWLVRGSMAMPLLLAVDKDIRKDAGKISVLLSETVLLANGFTTMTKGLVKRDRPLVFNSNYPLEDRLSAGARLSFFSGHTSMSAGLSFFTAKIWSDYHPESKWKPLVWTAAAAVPAVTGYLRYKAGKHYFTDVAVGYAVGAVIGYFVPHFHKIDRRSKRKFRISSTMFESTPLFVMKYRF